MFSESMLVDLDQDLVGSKTIWRIRNLHFVSGSQFGQRQRTSFLKINLLKYLNVWWPVFEIHRILKLYDRRQVRKFPLQANTGHFLKKS